MCRLLESNVKQLNFVKLFSDDVQPVNGKGKKKRRRVVSSDEEDDVIAKKRFVFFTLSVKIFDIFVQSDIKINFKHFSSPKKSVKVTPEKPAEKSPSRTPKKSAKVPTPVQDRKVATPVKDAKVDKKDNDFVTSPIKFENDENDSPKTKKQTKASGKSKAKTPKANAAKKAKIDKKTTPKSTTASPKETSNVPADANVKKEEPKAEADVDKKKENVKTEQESPLAKKPAAIHSFFTSAKTPKAESSKGSVSGVDYNPEKQKYHPIDDAFWNHGEKYDPSDHKSFQLNKNSTIIFRVPYLALARTFEKVEDISGRLKMIEVLSNFYRSVIVLSPNDLVACVYLCLNQLAPSHEGMFRIELPSSNYMFHSHSRSV